MKEKKPKKVRFENSLKESAEIFKIHVKCSYCILWSYYQLFQQKADLTKYVGKMKIEEKFSPV